MIGRTLSHYRVVEQIGAGAMGVVYRAQDLHLPGREVALKVLPPSLLGDESAIRRFRKGAIALSRLRHPHIAEIYDLDSDGGQVFLIMEYVPGETLSALLDRGGLSEREVLKLGIQLTEGLAAAHEQGVLHRDLKPANVRVAPEGRSKILDFGLAKLLPTVPGEPLGSDASTETQEIVGTLAYMAPEALRGERTDPRTDVYSVGVMLYEMACGRRPFQAGSGPALVAEILSRPAPPPGRFKPQLSHELEGVLLKAIEKEPDRRYQSARDLLADLRRIETPSSSQQMAQRRRRRRVALTALAFVLPLAALLLAAWWRSPNRWGSPAIRGPSVAVLPLANLSGDASQEYFADGMTEAIITDLARIGALRVISRTSSMRFKGTRLRPTQVARQLGVGHVLAGSVQRNEGGRVRITAELIDARTETDVWADQFDGDIQDVLTLQSQVAQSVARQIQVLLTPDESRRLAVARPVDPQAYDLYLRGRAAFYLYSSGGLREAVRWYSAAIARDSTFAPAWAGLSMAEAQHFNIGADVDTMRLTRAVLFANRAIRLQPDLAEGSFALGFADGLRGDWLGARRAELRAIELEPNHAPAHSYLGYVYEDTGFLASAQKESERAIALDPFLAPPYWTLSLIAHSLGDHRRALEMLRRSPLRDTPLTAPAEARELFELGDLPGLDSLAAKIATYHWEAETFDLPRAFQVMAREGKPFQPALSESLGSVGAAPARAVVVLGSIAAFGGAEDASFVLLEAAVRGGYCNETLLRRAREFARMRATPRYQRLLRRASELHRGLAETWKLTD